MTPARLVMVGDVDVDRSDATRTHTVEIARGFAAAGLAVELVTRGTDPRLPGVRFRRAGAASPPLPLRIASVNAHALAALLAHRGDRLCYLRHDWGLVPTIVAARALRFRIVAQVDDMADPAPPASVASTPRKRVSRHLRRAAERLMARAADGIVAVTPGIRDNLVRDYGVDPQRVRVLPNGVDVDIYRPVSRADAIARCGLDPGCRYVTFTGLFAGWVDFDTMIAGFAGAAKNRPDARLLLVGDGPQMKRVQALVKQHGLAGRVILTGFVGDRARVWDLIGSSTLCVAAHRLDRIGHIGVSPTKLAEYLAAARAVVVVAVPGAREIVEDSGGGIAVPADPAAMAQAIGGLLDDPEAADELGRAGRRAAEVRYSWRSVVERTLPLLLDAHPAESRWR